MTKHPRTLAAEVADELVSTTRDDVLRELAALVVDASRGEEIDSVVDTLKAREELGSTGIGGGIAIPHARFKGLDETKIAFGRSKKGVEFNAIDGKPVDLFFLLLAPENAVGEHLKTLARISRLLKNQEFCRRLRQAGDAEEILNIIAEEEKHF